MIFVISGTYVWKKRLGRVAAYCPVCRTASAFKLLQVRSAQHIFFVPLWYNGSHGHVMRCESCKQELAADIDRYARVSRDRHLSLEALIDLTRPGLWEDIDHRRELDDRLARDELTADEREALLAEPLAAIERELRIRAAQMQFDLLSALALLVAIAVPSYFAFVAHWLPPKVNEYATWSTLILGLLWVAYLIKTDARRFAQRKLLPRIAPALAAYRPTYDDAVSVLDRFRRKGWAVGRHVRPQDVMAAVNRLGPHHPPDP